LPCAIALLTPAVVWTEDQVATFRSLAEYVRVDVLVRDRSGPVRGLTAMDFEIRDDGVLQEIAFASTEDMPVNVALLFDLSTSIDATRLGHMRSAGAGILEALKDGDQAALVTFNHQVSERNPLTADISRVRRALTTLNPSGGTALVDASYVGLTVAAGEGGRSVAIVFSDGVDTASWLTPDQVVGAAKRSEVTVYAVSAGNRLPFLPALTEATGGRLFEVESTQNLRATFLEILEEFRHRYLLAYTPKGVKAGGYHRLDVQVKRRGVTVRARPGYDASGMRPPQ
jgi:VWFA-related protein